MTTIMRYSFILLSFFLACCNNNEQPVTKIDNSIPSKEKELRDAIAQYPDSLLLYETLVQYFRSNGDYDMALRETENVLRRDSSNARFWDIKGTLQLENGDTLNGISSMEKSIDYFPEPSNIVLLGGCYAITKNAKALILADALLLANKAVAEKEAILIKGMYYSNIGEAKKAITFFDQILNMDYTYMFAYKEKALTLLNTGKYEEAIELLTRATTLQNNFDDGYYLLGRCYEKKNNLQNAIESYKNAAFYNPDNIEAKEALAKLGVK